jgi:hypothetical protein
MDIPHLEALHTAVPLKIPAHGRPAVEGCAALRQGKKRRSVVGVWGRKTPSGRQGGDAVKCRAVKGIKRNASMYPLGLCNFMHKSRSPASCFAPLDTRKVY